MAELLGLCASIIAVVQIADRVAKLCKDYIGGVKDCPSNLRAIEVEVSSLSILLKELEQEIKSGSNASALLCSLKDANGPIEGCRIATSELEKLFPSEEVRVDMKRKKKRRTAKLSLAALAWPFREEKARTLLCQLMQHKATISLAICTESL
jgi:hypothetical protein